MRIVELAGTPREMGRQYGEELRESARAMVQTRLDLATAEAEKALPGSGMQWCLQLAEECVKPLQDFSLPVYEELLGLSEASGLSMAQLVIGNGWTDFRDLIRRGTTEAAHECTSLVVGKQLGAEGRLYLAQTWDMSASAGPYMVLVRRKPQDAPATLSLTTAGCLSLIGMNETGIAIGNTNLEPNDARPGVHYLALIHEALRQTELPAAVERIIGAQRLSGHYYYLGGPEGSFCGLETSGERHRQVGLQDGLYVHTNHYRDGELAEQVGEMTPGANSAGRQDCMETLASGLTAGTTATDISQLLRNHDGEHVICRHAKSPSDAATLAAVVMCPERREMLVAVGNPCTSEFEMFTV